MTKTLDGGLAEELKEERIKELLEISLEVTQRYATTLATILVEEGGMYEFDPISTTKVAGKHVDFEIVLLENGRIQLKLVVDKKPWNEESTKE